MSRLRMSQSKFLHSHWSSSVSPESASFLTYIGHVSPVTRRTLGMTDMLGAWKASCVVLSMRADRELAKCLLVGGKKSRKSIVECAEIIKQCNARILEERLHRTGPFPTYGNWPALRERS